MFDQVSRDILALLNLHEDITGFSQDTLLKLSLLLHYPDLFKYLELSIDLPLVIKSSFHLFKTNIVTKNLHPKMITFSDTFPGPSSLLPKLRDHSLFSHFSNKEAYPALIESLIILFHFVVQPHYIISQALHHHSPYFQLGHITIHPEMMNDYINLTEFQNYHTRRLESWFEKQIFQRLHIEYD